MLFENPEVLVDRSHHNFQCVFDLLLSGSLLHFKVEKVAWYSIHVKDRHNFLRHVLRIANSL